MSSLRQLFVVPRPAAWLGAAGLLPFATFGFATAFLGGPSQTWALSAIIAYAAVVLSFLGGIRWGLAIAVGDDTDRGLASRLSLSVLPSLVACAGLLVLPKAGLAILAIGFTAMLVLDTAAARAGNAPAWYPRLRWPLSGGVFISLALAYFSSPPF